MPKEINKTTKSKQTCHLHIASIKIVKNKTERKLQNNMHLLKNRNYLQIVRIFVILEHSKHFLKKSHTVYYSGFKVHTFK